MKLNERLTQLREFRIPIRATPLESITPFEGLYVTRYGPQIIECITDSEHPTIHNNTREPIIRVLIAEIGHEMVDELFEGKPSKTLVLERHVIVDYEDSMRYSFHLPSTVYLS